MTKEYKIESCHSIGIAWDITAPEELTSEEVEELMEEVCNWTDAPEEETVKFALDDWSLGNLIENSDVLKEERIELYRKLEASPDVVHREFFTQSFAEGGRHA